MNNSMRQVERQGVAEREFARRGNAVKVGVLQQTIAGIIDECGEASEAGGVMPGNENRLRDYARIVIAGKDAVLGMMGTKFIADVPTMDDKPIIFRRLRSSVEGKV